MLLVHLGFLLTGIVTTMLGPILPVLAARWHLDDARAGYLFTLQFCSSTLGTAASSRFMQRIGSRNVMLAGFVLMSIGVGILATGSWTALLLGISCYGLGLGFNLPATNLLVVSMFSQRRGAALNLINFAWSAGAVAAPPLFGVLLGQVPLSTILTGVGIAIVAVALAIAATMPHSIDKTAPQPGSAHSKWFPHTSVALLSVLLFVYIGTETAIGGWLATYAQRMSVASLQEASLVQAAFWGALLAGRGLGSLLLNRVRERDFLILSLGSALCGVLVLLTSSHPAAIAGGSILSGLGLAGVFPTAVAIMTALFGAAAERRMGPIFATVGLGGAVIPWLVGQISKQFQDLRVGMAVCAFAIVGMLLLALRVASAPAEAIAERLD